MSAYHWRWYVVAYVPDFKPARGASKSEKYTLEDYLTHVECTVVRAMSKENAVKNVAGIPWNVELVMRDHGGYRYKRVLGAKEFESKAEADSYLESLGPEKLERLIERYYRELEEVAPYDKATEEILRTRVCVEVGGLRPLTELCRNCPHAQIYSDDCELFWLDNHEPYFVPEGE